MIARRWRGWTEGPAKTEAYVAHFEGSVRPQLEGTEGFVDVRIERVEGGDGRTEITVVTRWASIDAIRGFAGDDVDVAVVEPEARAALADFDTHVRHLVLDGELLIDLEGAETIRLRQHQACTVPQGVVPVGD